MQNQSEQGSHSYLKMVLELVTAPLDQDDVADSRAIEEKITQIDKNIKPRQQIYQYNKLHSRLLRVHGGTERWSRTQQLSAMINIHSHPAAISKLFCDALQDDEKDWKKMPLVQLQAHYVSTAKKYELRPPDSDIMMPQAAEVQKPERPKKEPHVYEKLPPEIKQMTRTESMEFSADCNEKQICNNCGEHDSRYAPHFSGQCPFEKRYGDPWRESHKPIRPLAEIAKSQEQYREKWRKDKTVTEIVIPEEEDEDEIRKGAVSRIPRHGHGTRTMQFLTLGMDDDDEK